MNLDFQAGGSPLASRQNPLIYAAILLAGIIIAVFFLIYIIQKKLKEHHSTPEWTKYGFWVKKKDKNFFAETCGLGIASYSINESTMSGWIIFVNGVYVEWGEDISSSSISAINLSNAYNLVSYKVYLTAVGNVSTLPTVLNDNSHLKSMQSFYIKKTAGYPVFWLTIGTTNI